MLQVRGSTIADDSDSSRSSNSSNRHGQTQRFEMNVHGENSLLRPPSGHGMRNS